MWLWITASFTWAVSANTTRGHLAKTRLQRWPGRGGVSVRHPSTAKTTHHVQSRSGPELTFGPFRLHAERRVPLPVDNKTKVRARRITNFLQSPSRQVFW